MATIEEAQLIQEYKDDLTTDTDMVLVQSRLADDDMRFVNVDGGQWEDWALDDDFNDRAKLEFDIVSDYVYDFVGEWNLNRVGVEYKPEDGATEDDAELLNGIYRADFRDNSGKMATDNAVDEVATVGYGCFKLKAFFEDEGDPENDLQRIEWEPINNAYDTVIWDNAAKRIDKRDARRCTELIPFTKQSFEDKWPDKKPISAFAPESRFHSDYLVNPEDIIYVAARYDVIKKTEIHFIYNNLKTGDVESFPQDKHEEIKDELANDEFRVFVRERKIKTQIVKKVVFSGDDVLEKSKRIAGRFIPIIPIYGYHAFVDNSERYRGLVRKLKDAARLFNSQVSQLAENSASSGQEIPIFTPDQIDGYEEDWANRNNKPYLVINKQLDDQGNVIAAAPTSYVKPPSLDQSTSTLMQIVPAYVQQVTGRQPEETRDPRASGKAIKEARKLSNLGTQILTDNIHNSITWSGVVWQSMAADGIYTIERTVNTLGKDGIESQEQLMKTVLDEKTGRLVDSNNLDGKRFRAYSDIGPQTETLRESTVEDMKGMLDSLANNPAGAKYTDVVVATMIDNISGIGLGPLKDFNRQQMILAGYVKPKTDEEKAFLQQAQQQQQQPDPQAELVAAAAAQQQAEARNLDAASLEKGASAQLKGAQTEKAIADTRKVLSDISVDQQNASTNKAKTLADIRKDVLEGQQQAFSNLQELPIQ